jgi:anti-sigma factor RsiW
MMETIEMLRKRIVDARAAQDHAAIDKLAAEYAAMGDKLHQSLQRYGDRIVEAACCNNAQRLRDLHDGLRALRDALIEWRLVAEELGVFTRSGSVNGGGGGCSPCAPAASFTSGEASDV